MDTKKLSKFLVDAKKNTYASKGETDEFIFIDGGKELKFKESEFLYIWTSHYDSALNKLPKS